jgi:hypothetical protein
MQEAIMHGGGNSKSRIDEVTMLEKPLAMLICFDAEQKYDQRASACSECQTGRNNSHYLHLHFQVLKLFKDELLVVVHLHLYHSDICLHVADILANLLQVNLQRFHMLKGHVSYLSKHGQDIKGDDHSTSNV